MIPLHPKRHLVSVRDFSLDPQDHQLQRDAYRGSTYGSHINPWILDQLRSTERFNITAGER